MSLRGLKMLQFLPYKETFTPFTNTSFSQLKFQGALEAL